jgi:ABC-type hemin transport system ATPase subunit
MVLIHRPAHGVLLDEPSLGQDSLHKRTLIHALRAVAQSGVVVLMATHDLELAAQAGRLLLLSRRGVLADGPPGQVLADAAAWNELGLVVPEWVHL